MMKYLYIVLFFVTTSLNAQSLDNVIYQKEPTSFKSDGIHIEHFDSGEKKAIKSYHFDKLNGEAKSFYRNGQLKSHGRYKDNKKKGLWIYYYSNGKIKSKENYRYGMLRGYFKSYYENGEIKIEGNFIDFEQQNGLWFFYSNNGQLIEQRHYKRGVLVSTENHKTNGDLSTKTDKVFQKYQPLLRPVLW